ncbi:MAG TPA: hypothetical protein VHV82_20360 [Sporichthyaceae bacterium]|jgi:hypothetical protein|nr:hypothetical protein [Sporichthyaceae bacterium]
MNLSVKFAAAAAVLLTGSALAAAPVHAVVSLHGTGGAGIAGVTRFGDKPVPTPLPRPTMPAVPKPAPKKP